MTDSSTYVEHVADCGCPACSNFDDTAVIDLGANVDGSGGTIDGKVVYDLATIIANLNRTSYPGTGIGGPGWSFEGVDARPSSGDPLVITFGFQTAATMFATPYVYPNAAGTGLVGRVEYFGFQAFSSAQVDATRKSIALWDDLIKVTFQETSAATADLTYGNYTNQPGTQAYAFLPYNYSGVQAKLAGDVWVNALAASNLQLGNGFYGLATLIHETGHALGLQHPGAYNAAPGLSITYAANAEFYQDTRQYSQMSYFNAEFSGGGHIDWNRLNWVYGQTPLLHDIATIQAMYGADLTTRTGDTVYGFNSNAGRDVFDFATNTMPVISIYDAGGEDTLDFSGWDTGSEIDLNPGAFSSGGGSGIVPLDVLKARGLLPASYTEEQYLALRARYNAVDGMLKDNISIAYGTTIENAIGGAGADTMLGNSVANALQGRAGNDNLNGRAGNDTLDGGLGDDTMLGGTGSDVFIVGEAGDVVTELAGEGTDTVHSAIDYALGANLEDLVLTGTAVRGTGNEVDNVITGNAGGNRLNGGGGNDTLIGGDGVDYLTGGAGDDVFIGEMNVTKVGSKNGDVALDVILDFSAGDKIDLSGIDAIAGTGGDQAFMFGGMSSNKTAGALTFKVYDSVNGAENALGIDIDGVDGPSSYTGPVTMVFGNIDGGAADFAIALIGVNGVNSTDFLL